jgi:hypothetical protein
MEIKEAVARISDLAEQNGQPVLEQLMEMGDSLDQYSKQDRIAYRIFMVAGAAMFAPVNA